MNRETGLRFGAVPRIHQNRSKIDLTHDIKTTFNNGQLIPLDVQEVLPGDTIQVDMSCLVRMATPIYPVMDNMWCDIYWFFIPRRLTYEHWAEVFGENDNEWTQTVEYEIPQIEAPSGGWAEGTIADYMGIPTYVDDISIDAQYFRSYAKVFSDWFRSENLQKSAHFYTDDTTRTGSNGTNYVTDLEKGGMPAQINRLHDMFSGCLPEPQKGPAVAIPLGTSANVTGSITSTFTGTQGTVPGRNAKSIYTGDAYEGQTGNKPITWGIANATTYNELLFKNTSTTSHKMYNQSMLVAPANPDTGIPQTKAWGIVSNTESPTDSAELVYPTNLLVDIPDSTFTPQGTITNTSNLIADLGNATAATINELRTAFAIQKYYEAAALYGTRYIEMLRGVFGVESSDARLQRSEYLGGMRFLINMNQIVQTSSTDTTSPQGNVAGMSCTNVNDSCFTKSFEEHGILMCLMATRTERTYQQGISRIFSRKKWYDFYNPYFANLGNQPVLNKEIYAQGSDVIDSDTGEAWDEEVFGYQEAWYDYRYIPNKVTGHMRSNSPSGSLDSWTYVDKYNSLPKLDATWLKETTDNVDNTIAVSSQLAHQLFGDFYIKEYATRVMPVYSMPGLIDHV